MEENQFHDAKRLKTCNDSKKLYICAEEEWPGCRTAFVLRVIEFDDLLRSALPRPMPTARQLAVLPESGSDLQSFDGCCVLGSKIYFVGGITPLKEDKKVRPPCKFVWSFDTNDPRHEIIRLPNTLNVGKYGPLMFEFAGKIYILGSNHLLTNFEVFDPDMGTWLPLPAYYYPTGMLSFSFSYCLAGTKLFVCNQFCKHLMSRKDYIDKEVNVISFDLADKDAQWKRVPSMCNGNPFPFTGQGLVLDVEQLDPNKKLLFALELDGAPSLNTLVVYIMSLDKDREDITEIFHKVLPTEFPDVAEGYHFFHLGGNHICLVNCSSYEVGEVYDFVGYKTAGVAMLFRFDIIKEKENERSRYSIDVTFQPPCRFGYEGLPQPDSLFMEPPPRMLGCFLL